MGSMLPNNVIGVIAFVVIFIAGHTLNLAINLLGAYVHTNRLQFVEFFGKFYEGGGDPFNPFYENSKNADEIIQMIPLEKMLIETDSPYLAPEPNRGTRNDSRNLKYLVEKIAQVKQREPEEIFFFFFFFWKL